MYGTESNPHGYRKVLIVDDEPTILQLLSRWLTGEGYDCVLASDGQQAWQLVLSNQFALLISDVTMPGFSGMDLLVKARERDPALAVIIVTAIAERATALQALSIGAYGYIVKPFEQNEVIIAVINALMRRQLEQQKKEYERSLEETIVKRTQAILYHQEQLRSLTIQLSLVEQRERRRIATVLHENISQSLALMSLQLNTLEATDTAPEVADVLASMQDNLTQAIAFTRSVTFELSPPLMHTVGLFHTVETLAESLSQQYHLQIHVTGHSARIPVSDDLRSFIFSAVRELLVNAIKHAKANQIIVTFRLDENIVMVMVDDDGIGFDLVEVEETATAKHKFGLFNLQEQFTILAGGIDIVSRPDHGTRVTLRIPTSNEIQHSEEMW